MNHAPNRRAIHTLPARLMVGHLPLEQGIGVRVPGRQPINLSMESESLKLARTFLGKKVHLEFDQPVGSSYAPHGIDSYPINYGYVPGVPAPDGDDLDAYLLGVSEPLKEANGVCIAIIHRTNDDDDKLIVVPEGVQLTDEEILKQTAFQ